MLSVYHLQGILLNMSTNQEICPVMQKYCFTKNIFLSYTISIMEYLNNIIEYYEELYPVTENQKSFYTALAGNKMPAHFLRIGCGSGALEHFIARSGHDVTGIDISKEILECANRRRRMPNTSIRFFQMSTLEMTRFLGKGFYNVISCLENKLIFIHDETLLRKFFYDCRQLLATDGHLIIELNNFSKFKSKSKVDLPVRESIRVKLYTELLADDDDGMMLNQELEKTGTNRNLPVLQREPVLPATPDDIKFFAREAGFSNIELYAGFDKSAFTEDSDTALFIMS